MRLHKEEFGAIVFANVELVTEKLALLCQVSTMHQVQEVHSVSSTKISQPAITCSKLTIETREQSMNTFKVNNKVTRMTSLTSFWCLYC